MRLAVAEATKATAVAEFAAAVSAGGADAERLFGAFEPVEMEVRTACEKELGSLRRAVTTAGALRSIGKARRTVVVVGGGIAGSLIARWLDRHHNEKLHVVLVDPKEYHECTLLNRQPAQRREELVAQRDVYVWLRAVVRPRANPARRKLYHAPWVHRGAVPADHRRKTQEKQLAEVSPRERASFTKYRRRRAASHGLSTPQGTSTRFPTR